MKVKRKRFVALKNPHLRKIRTELRNLLYQAFDDYHSRFSEMIKANNSNKSLSYKEQRKLNLKLNYQQTKLREAYSHSVVGCRVCGKRDVDLVYNPVLNAWFCEDCYAFNKKCQDELLPPGVYYP